MASSTEQAVLAAAVTTTTGGTSPSALVDFIAGTAGGIASLLAGHPFDTIKTRLQAQPSTSLLQTHAAPSIDASTATLSSKLVSSSHLDYASTAPRHAASSSSSGHAAALALPSSARVAAAGGGGGGGGGIHVTLPIYRSATDAFRIIVREERLGGLYKGVTSPMLGVAIMNASIFGLYNLSLRYQQSHSILCDHSTLQVLVAGMLSGLGSSLITSPIDLIKIREQMDARRRRRRSTWSVFRHVVRTEGWRRGVYRGWCTTAIRDLGYGPYFASYELLNTAIQSYTAKPLSNLDLAVSGAIAGVVAWISTFWADVIKTKIQASRYDASSGKSLFWSTASQTYREGGWRAFFVGVGPTVLRALPVNAVLFVTYETTKDLLVSRGF